MQRRRNLTLEGKVIIFKTFVLSKFVFSAQVLPIPNEITITIQRTQREFLWNSNNIKIRHKTIGNDQTRNCDQKLVPVYFINNAFGKKIIFHSNLFQNFCIASVSYFLRKHSSITEKKRFSYTLVVQDPNFYGLTIIFTIDNNSVHYKRIFESQD